MSAAPLRIAGIDPGLNATGYGILDFQPGKIVVVEAGVVRTKAEHPLPERLVRLHQDLTAIFREFTPRTVSIEQLYSHYAHPRTAVLMAHARGVVLLAAAEVGLEVRHYGATAIKRAVAGVGNASKALIQRAVQQRLGLRDVPEPPDVADALAAAICHGTRSLGS